MILNRRHLPAVDVVLLFVGCALGFWLITLVRLQTYRLLNIVGLIYTLLGAVVLAETFATPVWKSFCVDRFAPFISRIHSWVPFGAVLGEVTAALLHQSPWRSVFKLIIFTFSFWGVSLLVLIFFGEIVVSPSFPILANSTDLRWRWLGFFLVICGLLAQLIAAVLGLMT